MTIRVWWRAAAGAAVLLAVLLGGCRALQVDRSEITSPAGLITAGDLLFQRYAVTDPVAPPLEQVWIYNAAAGFGPGSPLLFRNTILVGTRKGEVHAIDFETGKKVGADSFGEAVEGTAVVQEGLLYVPIAGGRRALAAYALTTGNARWKVKGPPIEAGLLPLGKGVVAVDATATVRRYDPADGAVVWEQALGEGRTVHATPVTAADRVVVADDRGGLAALAPGDGAVAWTQSVGAPVYASMASDQRTLFVPTTRGRLVAVEAAQGRIRWRFTLPDTTVRFTTPAVAGGLVVFGASDGMVRALSAADGALRWSFDAGDAVAAPPLLTPGTVYVGTMGRRLFAVHRETGQAQWEQELKGRIKSAMAARDGYLVVLSEPRYVYLFKSTSSTSHAAAQ